MPEPTPKIYEALAAVMAEVDHVAKRERNSEFNFSFRGIDSVVNAVGPALRKHKVIVVPDVESVRYDSVMTSRGKPSTACRVVVMYTFAAVDGSVFTCRVAGEAWDSGDKATAKAMSVAFRIALLQALALPTDDRDPDMDVYEKGEEKDWGPVADTAEMMTKIEDVQTLWNNEQVGLAPLEIQNRIKAHGDKLMAEAKEAAGDDPA